MAEFANLRRLIPRRRLILRLATLLILVGLLVPPSVQAQAPADWEVAGGHFFTQTGGGTGKGYLVSDAEGVEFWKAFQSLGGVGVAGYPVTGRFMHGGFVTQAMQKAVFQWRPESKSVAFVNVFDDLAAAGKDQFLLEVRSTPRPASFGDESGKPFAEVIRSRQAVLDGRPAMRAAYFAVANPVLQYGLPTSKIEDMGNHYAVRLQRAVIQEWKVEVPWAKAGQATVANGGDIGKEAGLWPAAATAPTTAEAAGMTAPAASPPAAAAAGPVLDEYGGHPGQSFSASGFFKTARDGNGQWWLVTPAGNAFYAAGVSYTNPNGYASVAGANSYRDRVQATYGNPVNVAAWTSATIDRLKSWGFNAIGPYSEPSLGRAMPYSVDLGPLQNLHDTQNPANDRARDAYPLLWEDSPYDQYYRRYFYDVFHPQFESGVRSYIATTIAQNGYAADRRLIGYFVDNEVPLWYGRSPNPASPWAKGNTMADVFIGLPASTPGKQAWVALVRETYQSNIGALNAAWGTSFASFEQVGERTQIASTNPAIKQAKSAFLRRILARYYGTIAGAIRAVDGNHLYLGSRLVIRNVGNTPEVYDEAARWVDVMSVNYYVFEDMTAEELRAEMTGMFAEAYRDKPILISEYSFAGRDSGQGATHLNGAIFPTQAERAQFAMAYRQVAIESRNVVGDLWWDYMDPPREGSTHGGEDSNLGLVDNEDRPYLRFLRPLSLQNRSIFALRGLSQPWSVVAMASGLSVTLAAPARVTAEIYDGGAHPRRLRTLDLGTLPAGAHTIPWDRRDSAGATVGGGTYFVVIKATTSEGGTSYALEQFTT